MFSGRRFMTLPQKIILILLLSITLVPAEALTAVPKTGALSWQNIQKMGFKASREFSGKLFIEMQHKVQSVKLVSRSSQ